MPHKTLGSDTEAKDIVEQLLDVTGRALLSGDFKAFAWVFNANHDIKTVSEHITVQDEDDLLRLFNHMHKYFKTARVTEIIRICEAAEFVTPTKITSTHVSHLISDGTRLRAPYPVLLTNEFINGRWMVTCGQYDLPTNCSQARALRMGHNPNATPSGQNHTDAPVRQ